MNFKAMSIHLYHDHNHTCVHICGYDDIGECILNYKSILISVLECHTHIEIPYLKNLSNRK